MLIEIHTSKRRLTKPIVRQMPKGYHAVYERNIQYLGYVIGIIPHEMEVGIFKVREEYYTLPLDFEISSDYAYCFRYVKGKPIEIRFNVPGMNLSGDVWWSAYCRMRNEVLKKHIYLV